ncbi:MAG: hypothetical protein ABSB99_09270 [Acidimicrobiales bacterium]
MAVRRLVVVRTGARRVTRREATRFAGTAGAAAFFAARLRAGARFFVVRLAALRAGARFFVVRFFVVRLAALRAGARFFVVRFFVVRLAALRAGARFVAVRFVAFFAAVRFVAFLAGARLVARFTLFLALLTGIVDALLTAFWPIASLPFSPLRASTMLSSERA